MPSIPNLEPDIRSSFLYIAEEMLGFELYPWQVDCVTWFDDASNRMVMGTIATPNGSGKSSKIIPTLVLGWLLFYPKGRVVVTSADGKQIDSQLMPAIKAHRGRFPSWKFNEREIFTPTGGFFLAFTTDDEGRAEGFHKVDDTDGPLLMIVDEAKSVDDGIFQAIDRCTYNALLMTSSPGRMAGQFYDSIHKPELGYRRMQIGLKDCPHITQDKIDRILAKYGPNSPYTRSTLHGEFIETYEGAPVFYTYNQHYHEHEDLEWPSGAILCVGMDVGTRNASVIAAVKEDKKGELHIWVMREIILVESDTERQALALLQVLASEFPFWNQGASVCPQTMFFCDPAARNSSYTQRFDGRGNPIGSALKVLNTHGIFPGYKLGLGLQPSIAVVNRLLQQHRIIETIDFRSGDKKHAAAWNFRIDKAGCPELAVAMVGKYRYPSKGEAGYGKDEPMKGIACDHADHICFAANTRILCADGQRQIETLEIGDLVFTRAGIRRVKSIVTRSSKTFLYSFSNGTSLRCTPDHPFWSGRENRMKPIAKWTHLDTVFECSLKQRALSGMGRFIAAILIRSAGAIASISRTTRLIFTTLYGSFPTDQDRRGCTSITRMKTQETTQSIIFYHSLLKGTWPNISRQNESENRANTAAEYGLSQRHGTHPEREINGTPSTPRKLGLESCLRSKKNASSAGIHSYSEARLESPMQQSFAQIIANPHGVARRIWMMWIAFATFVQGRFGRINTRSRNAVRAHAVQNSERSEDVFNISVDGEHEYFANGILVSNCDAFRYMVCNIMDIAEEGHIGGMKAKYEEPSNPEPARSI